MTGPDVVVRAVTVIMGTVVGLTFLFGFGNVLSLGLRLGVPVWVAPLVAPAVDLSILGLLLGIRQLALEGASLDVLRPARRLLMFASAVTLALNVADPVVAGEYGEDAFDAVGPLLLIGWAEVGPGLLQAIGSTTSPVTAVDHRDDEHEAEEPGERWPASPRPEEVPNPSELGQPATRGRSQEDLLVLARHEDAVHRAIHQKPISAEALRGKLGIGSAPARRLVKIVRAEFQAKRVSEHGDPLYPARTNDANLAA